MSLIQIEGSQRDSSRKSIIGTMLRAEILTVISYMHKYININIYVQHACMDLSQLFYIKDMIENTWKWATANGKLIKHPISGGEFVDIDVEHFVKKSTESGTRMSQTASSHFQVSVWLPCDFAPYVFAHINVFSILSYVFRTQVEALWIFQIMQFLFQVMLGVVVVVVNQHCRRI